MNQVSRCYLPIVPVRSWLTSSSFSGEIAAGTNSALQEINKTLPTPVPTVARYPTAAEIQAVRTALAAIDEAGRKPVQKHLARAATSLSIFDAIAGATTPAPSTQDFEDCLGTKTWKSVREGLVTNSFRTDVHFLPADRQDPEWSAVPDHSLVLFRYPMTAPIEILDAAQDTEISDWQGAVSELQKRHPIASAFANRPLKSLRINNRFLGDLLSRYLALYLRMGSPDFTRETIGAYADQLGR